MFTGLIEDTGRVARLENRGKGALLTLETSLPLSEMAIGDSVAVNGICLTITTMDTKSLCFDVSPETMECSTFRRFRSGSTVNLERALRLGDRLGGHIVTGHIDCVARLSRSLESSGSRIMEFSIPAKYSRYLVAKGSVAIDGISLTVNDVTADRFSVNIIPHTLSKTTLSSIQTGAEVNIETDIIGKYVARLLGGKSATAGSGLGLNALQENGFL